MGAKAFEKVKDSAADEVRWVGYFSDGGRVPSMNLTILGQDWHDDDDDDDDGGGGDDDDGGGECLVFPLNFGFPVSIRVARLQ